MTRYFDSFGVFFFSHQIVVETRAGRAGGQEGRGRSLVLVSTDTRGGRPVKRGERSQSALSLLNNCPARKSLHHLREGGGGVVLVCDSTVWLMEEGERERRWEEEEVEKEGGGGCCWKAGTFQSGQQFFITAFLAQSCCGPRGRGLKQHTVGFLFRLLLFHWRFPIYLSDQVIEDIKNVDL